MSSARARHKVIDGEASSANLRPALKTRKAS
jgi:hypothetical protein